MPKPCPFCGGAVEIVFCDEGCCGARPRWIACLNESCGLECYGVNARTTEEAWAQWDNRRGG